MGHFVSGIDYSHYSLDSCPFCHGDAEMLREQSFVGQALSAMGWACGCKDRRCPGYMVARGSNGRTAQKRWNRRAK